MPIEHTFRPLWNIPNQDYLIRGITNVGLLQPTEGVGCFLAIQTVNELHDSVVLKPQYLKAAWDANVKYLRDDCKGVAPVACYPIYLITVGEKDEEKLVYVGKTSSENSRFKSGHKAISLLHHPKYNGLSKRLYQCSVIFIKDGKHLPIELIQPYEFAKKVLSSFEANLIFVTQPELNYQHKKKEPEFLYSQIHVQNICGKTDFWQDKFIA
ncbi:hypothetical protein [Vibrio kanaloae]|uniref:hypothetical protein n=1 Tax=Vibrio kanaloae TaxID=170673 RepID=UPI0010BD2530|nr:hypothetical protein [Vibrio kanaloae]TKE99722.1 hypothetical protein FCV46_18745 [Vibrio kanaloae]TKF55252.1 hypothetical protein FCV51_19485 [Vibrio kanaloae]